MAQGNGTTQTQGGTSGDGGTTDDKNKAAGAVTGDQKKGAQGKDGGDQGQQITYESLLAGMTDDEKKAIEDHTTGLRSALKSEREAKGNLERQLRDLSKTLDGNKDAQSKVDALANEVAKERQRADFYAEAHEQGVDDLELAFLAAQTKGLIDDRGRVNWTELKKSHAALFRQEPEAKIITKGAGGEGTRNAGGQGKPPTMNDWIRSGEAPTLG